MSKFFYMKLAFTNLKKNKESYLPYIISNTVSILIFFLLVSLLNNPGMENIPEKEAVETIFMLGKYITAVFVVVFIFYTNSFLMKRRKKEIALYGVLGLEKRHVAQIMFDEMVLIAAITLILGIVSGAVLGKLFFLIFNRILDISQGSRYVLEIKSVLSTLILFTCIYIGTFIFNYIQVKTANPISLLQAGSAGEKEPKASWFITLIGVATMGSGYYIAVTNSSVINSLYIFFAAVFLVVIGTYALFTSGSIALLKLMRKNKKLYYTPNNFISLSNMIYRMKKNAMGLANICLLSTMVIITISGTLLLYVSREETLRNSYPVDLAVSVPADAEHAEGIDAIVTSLAAEHNVEIKDKTIFKYSLYGLYRYQDNSFGFAMEEGTVYNGETIEKVYYSFIIMDSKQYNAITNSNLQLEEKQAFILEDGTDLGETLDGSITLLGKTYEVTAFADGTIASILHLRKSSIGNKDAVIVLKDEAAIKELENELLTQGGMEFVSNGLYRYNYKVNLESSEADKKELAAEVQNIIYSEYDYGTVESAVLSRETWNSLYGGLLFLGIILGILFTIAFVLIIYFKQISEGYEDQGRFLILEKVGMDKQDIQKTIFKQIKLVFILPLATAFIHVLAANPILCKLLSMMNLTDRSLIALGTVGVCAVFAFFYFAVYLLTAKVYKKILGLA